MDNNSDIKRFLFSDRLSDIQLACNGEHIHSHKFLLAAKSKVFEEIFEKNPSITVVQINGIDEQALKEFLQFLYTNTFVLNEDMNITGGVMKLAVRYGIAFLSTLLIKAIDEKIEKDPNFVVNNLLALMAFTTTYDLKQIYEKVVHLAKQQTKRILSNELSDLNKESLKRLVMVLEPTQSLLIECITPAVVANSGRNKSDFEALIDLKQCSSEDIIHLIRNRLFESQDLLVLLEASIDEQKRKFGELWYAYLQLKELLPKTSDDIVFKP